VGFKSKYCKSTWTSSRHRLRYLRLLVGRFPAMQPSAAQQERSIIRRIPILAIGGHINSIKYRSNASDGAIVARRLSVRAAAAVRKLEKVTTVDFVLPGQARNKPLSNMSTESRYRSHWLFRFFSVSPMYPPTTCSNSSSAS
jgi:hypothetical protein